ADAVDAEPSRALVPAAWLTDPEIRRSMGANEWRGETYVEREAFEDLVDALAARDILAAAEEDGAANDDDTDGDGDARAAARVMAAEEMKARVASAGWRVGPSSAEPEP
ncbi:MAG: hypothetical protein M3452_10120, partial [Chloroflexota bacterium]|nr:hypothetical protein [Chloroflexota bacterium]